MNEIGISILMSVYAKEKPEYLRLALNSVYNQTVKPTEFILVEDGPLTSELSSVILEYSSNWPIFKIIKNKKNLGLGPSLAKGVLASTNEIIFRMDSDDIMAPNRIEKQLPFLLKGYDAVSCLSVTFKNNPVECLSISKRPETHNDILQRAHRRTPISHPGSCFKRSSVLRAGNYRNNILYEDYDLWVRMIVAGCRFYNVQEPLLYFRISTDTALKRGGRKYVKNEIRNFISFRKLGFYSNYDLIRNICTVSLIRLMPYPIRKLALSLSRSINDQSKEYNQIKPQLPPDPEWYSNCK